MTAKELHIAAGYFVRIITVSEIRGLIVEFPKNIFFSIPECKLIYELDDGQLNIYQNGSKVEVIKCPDYAQRHLVAIDITVQMTQRAMETSLSRAFNSDGESLTSEEDKMGLIDLILPSKNKKTRHLEFVFQNALNEFMKDEDVNRVPLSVIDGFEVVTNRYLKGMK